jgi:hypothetical protein
MMPPEIITIENETPLNLISPIATMSTKLSAEVQRVYWSMLYSAQLFLQDNPAQNVFEVSYAHLRTISGINGTHITDLKAAIEELSKTAVKFDFFGQNKKFDWGMTGLVAYARLRNDKARGELRLEFQLSKLIISQILNPECHSTMIPMQCVRNVKYGKYTYLILGYCADYSDKAKTPPKISVELFRDYLKLDDNQYTNFGDVKKKIIDPVLEELKKSPFNVSVEYFKKGAKIVELQFSSKVRQIKHCTDDSVLSAEEKIRQTSELIELLPADIQGALTEHVANALAIIGYEACKWNIDYSLMRMAMGKVRDLIPFIITALEINYAKDALAGEKKDLEKKEQKQIAARAAVIKTIADDKAKEILAAEERRTLAIAMDWYNSRSVERRAEIDKLASADLIEGLGKGQWVEKHYNTLNDSQRAIGKADAINVVSDVVEIVKPNDNDNALVLKKALDHFNCKTEAQKKVILNAIEEIKAGEFDMKLYLYFMDMGEI